MARHRDVRNMELDDHENDDDEYGYSYTDETNLLSSSMERDFIYRRNQSGTTPKMSSFLDNEFGSRNIDDDNESLRSLSRQSSLTDASFTDDHKNDKLSHCLEKILDIVGEAIPESIIRESIIKCDYDHELALNTILNNPPSKYQRRIAPHSGKEPCPVIVTQSDKKEINTCSTPVDCVIEHVVDKLSESNISNTSTLTFMRKGKFDVFNEYEKTRGASKNNLSLIVVGHVDSGKSTLMGHLLVNLGNVQSKVMHKYEQECRKLGKQSFHYAWVLDETSEERNRGITMDIGQNSFSTPTKNITVLDAPGHKDFIPNMITGVCQADVAILVVNATRGEFEAGFDAGGQTREHGLLVRSLGVTQIVVAVNKLDTVNWNESRFLEIKTKLNEFLRLIDFKKGVTYVPCSGFTGDNLTETCCHLKTWNSSWPTLLEAIETFETPERLIEKPFRLSVSDIFKPEQSAGFSVNGRIESGFVRRDDKVLILPANEIATVKAVNSDISSHEGFAGDLVTITLIGPDQNSLPATGMVLCDPQMPIPTTKRFAARIVVFNIEFPITKGFSVVLHYRGSQVSARIKKLVATINKTTGAILKNKPRVLLKNSNASVEIGVLSPICIELYSDIKELGRFMLRNNGKTIAAGCVTQLY